LRRCLVFDGGRLILSLGPADAPHGRLILVVFPESALAERRRVEGEWLRRLAALPSQIARAIPIFHGEKEVEGTRVFALSERPGMTVDHDVPFLPELTTTAAGWLQEFHRVTARPAEIDAALFARAFAPSSTRRARGIRTRRVIPLSRSVQPDRSRGHFGRTATSSSKTWCSTSTPEASG
jgi:hypothetical protein